LYQEKFAAKLSFEQFIHGDSQKNVEKIPELKLKIGGRPEGTKVTLFRKLANYSSFLISLVRSNHS
jgi:hypothetical protein